MSLGSNVQSTSQDSYHGRQGRLALAYKFAIKQILTQAETRYGKPLDPVFREAVMVEMQLFFHKAKELVGGENPVYEEFYHKVLDECRSLQTSKKPYGD